MFHNTCLFLYTCRIKAAYSVHIAFTFNAGVIWKHTSGNTILDKAVKGGLRNNGKPLYVARVMAPDGKYHPAKACDDCASGAHYYYDDTETKSYEYELLTYFYVDSVQWKAKDDSYMLFNALQGDYAEDVFICRAYNAEHSEIVVGEYINDKYPNNIVP